MNIIALIPAFNEAERIQPVIQVARRYLPVLVVDDGSRDDTAAVARSSGAEVVSQSPNQGKGVALRLGFQRMLELGCEAGITLDADGQHDPAEIGAFLAAYQAGRPDLILGTRNFSQIPPVRQLANRLGQLSFSWALGHPIQDNQSGYRLISRRLMEAVLKSQEMGFEFEVEMILIAVQRGYAIVEVPIRTIYGSERSHIQPLKHILGFIRILIHTRRSVQKP